MSELGPDRQVAWHVLGVVLRALRNRVPLELAVHLGSQLPVLIRGTYYDQWQPANQPDKSRSLDEFLQRVGRGLADIRLVNARDATRTVFHVLSRHVDRGQVEKVRNSLPEEVRGLWPEDFLADAPTQGASRGESAPGPRQT